MKDIWLIYSYEDTDFVKDRGGCLRQFNSRAVADRKARHMTGEADVVHLGELVRLYDDMEQLPKSYRLAAGLSEISETVRDGHGALVFSMTDNASIGIFKLGNPTEDVCLAEGDTAREAIRDFCRNRIDQ